MIECYETQWRMAKHAGNFYSKLSSFQTEQSLANLQRSLHPMTLQKLRGILHLQQQQQQQQQQNQQHSEQPKGGGTEAKPES